MQKRFIAINHDYDYKKGLPPVWGKTTKIIPVDDILEVYLVEPDKIAIGFKVKANTATGKATYYETFERTVKCLQRLQEVKEKLC